MNGKNTKRLKSQRGIAMMVALLALLLLAAIGMGLMFMADTENSVNNNYRDSQKAYFAARAGAEEARLLLATDANVKAKAMGLVMPASNVPTGMLYLTNPSSSDGGVIDPTAAAGTANPYLDDQLCWERYNLGLTPGSGPCGSNAQGGQLLTNAASYTPLVMAAPGEGGADAQLFKWVRITNKQNLMGPMGAPALGGTKINGALLAGTQVCWDGTNEIVSTSALPCAQQNPVLMPVWELTSLAVTPQVGANPGSRRIVQMEVAFKPPLIPPAPISTQAPVTLQGSFVLNAYDFCSCTCVPQKNGPTTCGGPACQGNAHAIFTQNTVTQVGSSTSGQTITSYGTDPTGGASLQNQNPWPNSLNINNLINQYRPGAAIPSFASSCTGTANPLGVPPTYMSCGIQTSQTFGTYPSSLLLTPPVEPINYNGGVTEYIPGSVKLTSAATGGGILIVDGDLEINGGLNWYGLILVRGKVSFTGGAGASTNLYGAILAGQDVSATDQAQTDGDKFGGSINFNYDVCALNNLGQGNPPQLLATHEIMY
jgi:Tfp pilus assembly protein PilX